MLVHWPLGVSSKPKPQQRYYFGSIKSIEKICENDRVRLEPGPRETQAISLTQNAPSLTVYRDGPTRALQHYTGPAEGQRLLRSRRTIAVQPLYRVVEVNLRGNFQNPASSQIYYTKSFFTAI